MAERISEEKFEELVLKEENPVLVDFYSDSCVPCKMMAGILGELEEECFVKIFKVNVNYEEKLAETYGVLSVPTFLLFQKGQEKQRFTGVVAKDVLQNAVAEAAK